jgi:tRNA threonylcarbamoyladenosine biosynthesis protein TsaB
MEPIFLPENLIMIILALDSSTDACSVALNMDGEIHTRFELAAKSHTQRLLPMVDELLAAAEINLRQLDAIAFGCGPGSFTGLRICMGVVQGLAFGAGLPVVPVSTLASMALTYHQKHSAQSTIIPSLDARMNEVYWGLYQIKDGLPVLQGEEAVTAIDTFAQQDLLLELKGNFAAVGQGWQYSKLVGMEPKDLVLDIFPNAEAIAKIASPSVANGQIASILDTAPVYLRDSVSWQKRPAARRRINIGS